MTDQWVDVVFLQDEEYDEIADMSIEEMADYMAQWDYGTETDAAHIYNGQPWGVVDLEYEVSVGATDYVLAINRSLGYASLNRRPINRDEA